MIRRLLFLILAAYVLLALAYVYATPPWQNPDEPAHYNYARSLADSYRLPVLDIGDYDGPALERLKASRFAGDPDISAIRYEDYQPPLYYAIGGALMALEPGQEQGLYILRLLSVLCGAVLLVVVYTIGREVVPDDPAVALGATALVAFIPQHMAMTAAANNDVLGELLLAAMVLLGIRRIKGLALRSFVIVGGVLLGLAFLTKVTAYTGAALLVLAEVGYWRLRPGSLRSHVQTLAGIAAGALLIGGWWFVRNALTYGNLDILGQQRHNLVVLGQPRTVIGLESWRHFAVTTFQSFWALFGWMGVLVDARIYALLALLSALALAGLAIFALRSLAAFCAWQRWALALLGLQLALMLGVLLAYNVTYIQPQGRYLFPASAAIGVFAALGLREMMARPRLLAALAALGCLAIFLTMRGSVVLALGASLAVAIPAARFFARQIYPALAWGALAAGLVVLDLVCLTQFIVPALRV